jgi:hypothetical protein
VKDGIDMVKFEKSIERFSKQFGDSNEQAICRWGVQAARELAVVTAVFGGRGRGSSAAQSRKRQLDAIWKDALQIILAVDAVTRTAKGWKVSNQGKTYYISSRQYLSSPAEINQWIRINRTRRRRRTAKLDVIEKKVALRKNVEKAVRERHKSSGEAKGGWLAAGKSLAQKQTGAQRITIGASFLGYAQKTRATGSGTLKKGVFNPSAFLTNNVPHSSDKSVLSANQAQKAIDGALPNTLKWYRSALRAINRKK